MSRSIDFDNIAATLGYEPDSEVIILAISAFGEEPAKSLRSQLRRLEREFEEEGGRGVDLADEIDMLRIALAARGLDI